MTNCAGCFGCIRMARKHHALCAWMKEIPAGVRSYYDEDFNKSFPIVSSEVKSGTPPVWCPRP